MKDLPTYYYLDHFQEFITHITATGSTLLRPVDQAFIALYLAQSKPVQCTLVRGLNRKHPYFQISSLAYTEIPDSEECVAQCRHNEWFTAVPKAHFYEWLALLTKPELLALLTSCTACPITLTTKKSDVLNYALEHIEYADVQSHPVFTQYVYRQVDQVMRYLLFLFFGNTKSRLNQFSMRDLGVMRTRKRQRQGQARFTTLAQAQSTYWYARQVAQIKHQQHKQRPSAGQAVTLPSIEETQHAPVVVGDLAQQQCDEWFWLCGKISVQQGLDWQVSYHYFSCSTLPEAQEKAIRLAFQHGCKDKVQQQLEHIIDQPDSLPLLHFAQDFLARKYHKKRTSVMTDMLRNSAQHLILDEVHKHRVEAATVEHYTQQGKQAFRTENELWRSLFGLTFWSILFAPEYAIGGEFDNRPYHIRHNNLYDSATQQVQQILTACEQLDYFKQHLIKQATSHYGQSNGIFRWHKRMLERLLLLVTHISTTTLTHVLMQMAQDYARFSDGFPDVMLLSDAGLCFEEIKAQGDSIRKNQLSTMAMLKAAGVVVSITTVQWGINPNQPYVVVDIETTGGKAALHRITEIGMVKVVRGEIVAEYETLLNPQRRIPRNITSLTGIDDAMVADAPIFAEVAQAVAEFTEGCIFVAHNVNFDYGFIKQEFTRIEQRFSRAKLCTVREMRKARPGLTSYSLANLTAHFDIRMQRHHRAMSDALAANALLTIINEYRMQTCPVVE